jgi:uncharacterized phage-associated protein
MPFPFVFNREKAIEAVGVLLRSNRHRRMHFLRLLKLLYIADRESLRDTGRFITGDRPVAMKRGPVLNAVYGMIKGENIGTPTWNKYFRCDGWELCFASREPSLGELSRYEIEKLTEIARRYEDKDEWGMVEETHKLPEWSRNNPGDSVREIPLSHILEAVGRAGDLELIEKEEGDRATFDRIFNTPPPKASTGGPS